MNLIHPPSPFAVLTLALGLASALLAALGPAAVPARADVRLQDCAPSSGGGITCDTRPEGATLLNDEAARFGLFEAASPGWDEFDPYAADDALAGGKDD